MEEIRLLHEVLAELLDNGYSANFGLMEYICSFTPGNKELIRISGADFTIDDVYCCQESEYDSEVIYVFAISCTKYNLKGISTSIHQGETPFSFSEILEKIKIAWMKIF